MKLLDGRETRNSAGVRFPRNLTIWRETNRLDVVNTYCLLASSSPRESWEPLSWEFRGSADGNNWDFAPCSDAGDDSPRGRNVASPFPPLPFPAISCALPRELHGWRSGKLLFRGNSVPAKPFHVVDETSLSSSIFPREFHSSRMWRRFKTFPWNRRFPRDSSSTQKTGTLFRHSERNRGTHHVFGDRAFRLAAARQFS